MYDLRRILNAFGARITKEVQIPTPRWDDLFLPNDFFSTATATARIEEGYEIVISKRQLLRLLDVLKSKGYYHDEDYQKRMAEEELILSNHQLKQLHDQYKMYLYMLCGDHWEG